MRDDDERRPGLGVEFEEQVLNRLARLRIEVAGRFIGEEDAGAVDEGPCERHPLLLAARKLGRVVVGAVAEPDAVEEAEPFGVATLAAQLERDGDVFERRQRRDQAELLEDEPDGSAPDARAVVLVERRRALRRRA